MRSRLRALFKRHLDPQTRAFTRDAFKLSVGSAVVVGGYALQIALISHFLGLNEFGTFAIVVAFVDLVARLLDFQVGQMVTAFGADSLRSEPRKVAGIAQFGYLVDGAAGIVGFTAVLVLSPLVAPHLFSEGQSGWLFVLYALTMLVTTTETTSISLLQLSGRFSTILRLTLVRETLRFILVLTALLTSDSLEVVILALVVMEMAMAILWTSAASESMYDRLEGAKLWKPELSLTAGFRGEMTRMIFHTNAISYVKVAATQGPTLLLGAMRPPAEVGAFKVGTAIAAVVGKPADPAWAAVLPRFAKLRAAGQRAEIQGLIRQTSIGALLAISILGVVVIVLREPLLRLVGGPEALTAAPVLVIGVVAQIVNGTLFWNSPLLFALKRAGAAAFVFVSLSFAFVPVLVVCIDRWGATGAAGALLFWTVMVNGGLTIAALLALRRVQPQIVASASPSGSHL